MSLNSRRNSGILIGAIGLGFIGLIVWQWLSMRQPGAYDEALLRERERKDLQFRNAPESPIPGAAKKEFKGLRYYPINPAYRVEATFTAFPTADTLSLVTTKGTAYRVIRSGTLSFTLQGTACTLVAYRYTEPAKNDFFIPFRDLTSGAHTYGGGRYLETPAGKDPVILDFNRAYNPYCVYNPDYVCPLPPAENRLALEVAAGELNP
jgi:uncharacterized protein (DUF1684 family)